MGRSQTNSILKLIKKTLLIMYCGISLISINPCLEKHLNKGYHQITYYDYKQNSARYPLLINMYKLRWQLQSYAINQMTHVIIIVA